LNLGGKDSGSNPFGRTHTHIESIKRIWDVLQHIKIYVVELFPMCRSSMGMIQNTNHNLYTLMEWWI